MIAANLVDFTVMEILGRNTAKIRIFMHVKLNINLGVYFCILVILQKLLKKSLPVNKAVVFMLNQENQIVGQITKLCKGFYPDDTTPHMYIQAYCRKR